MVPTVPLTFSGFPRLAQPSVHMCVVLSHRDIRTAKCTQEFRELKPNVQKGLCQQRPGPLQRYGAPAETRGPCRDQGPCRDTGPWQRHGALEMSDGGQGGNTGVCLSMDHRHQAGIQALWNPKSAQRSQERNQGISLSKWQRQEPRVKQLPADVLLLFEGEEGLLGKSLLRFLLVYCVCVCLHMLVSTQLDMHTVKGRGQLTRQSQGSAQGLHERM